MISILRKLKNKLFWIIFIFLVTISCKQNEVFLQYKTVLQNGWNKDSIYTFDIPITDTKAHYNVYINVRNRGEYSYQNLWLFLSKELPDKQIVSDTIECYLADQRGKWLGSGIGSVYDMPVLYEQNVQFKAPGVYHYKIIHGMRDNLLIGINDIGMKVEKVDN